jgi:hypothetical protein
LARRVSGPPRLVSSIPIFTPTYSPITDARAR